MRSYTINYLCTLQFSYCFSYSFTLLPDDALLYCRYEILLNERRGLHLSPNYIEIKAILYVLWFLATKRKDTTGKEWKVKRRKRGQSVDRQQMLCCAGFVYVFYAVYLLFNILLFTISLILIAMCFSGFSLHCGNLIIVLRILLQGYTPLYCIFPLKL